MNVIRGEQDPCNYHTKTSYIFFLTRWFGIFLKVTYTPNACEVYLYDRFCTYTIFFTHFLSLNCEL